MDICRFLKDAMMSQYVPFQPKHLRGGAAYVLLRSLWVLATYEGKQLAAARGLTIQDDWDSLWPDPWKD